MNGDDQRDYDEERANAQIDRDDTGIDFPDFVAEMDNSDNQPKTDKDRRAAELVQLRAFAERVASLHYWVATNVNADVCAYTSTPYNQTQSLLKSAIRRAYPELDITDIEAVMDFWVDCGETIQCSVDSVKEHKADIAREEAEADKADKTDEAPQRPTIDTPRGSKVEYRPDGQVMPIEDDQCHNGVCRGAIGEVDTRDNEVVWFVMWETTCERHNELTSGHHGLSWERANDLALI